MKSPDASHLLFAIKEDELPEVHGSSFTPKEMMDEPDDASIIASFSKTQESFLERILVRATVCSTKRPISEWQEYMDIKTHFKTFLVLDSCLELQKVSAG